MKLALGINNKMLLNKIWKIWYLLCVCVNLVFIYQQLHRDWKNKNKNKVFLNLVFSKLRMEILNKTNATTSIDWNWYKIEYKERSFFYLYWSENSSFIIHKSN